jgi:hypothetical protein
VGLWDQVKRYPVGFGFGVLQQDMALFIGEVIGGGGGCGRSFR